MHWRPPNALVASALVGGLIGCAAHFGRAKAAQLGNPIEAMESLKAAIVEEQWAAARQCFSQEIQDANAAAIGTKAFYLTDYWTESRSIQNMFHPVLILDRTASFRIAGQYTRIAQVAVTYTPPREKDVRLRRVRLEKDGAGNWRVSEIYGGRVGVAAGRKPE